MLESYYQNNEGLSKDEMKQYTKFYQTGITGMQQQLKNSKIPVVVLVEGLALSNKNYLVNELISEIDPRFARVVIPKSYKLTKDRPFIEQFYNDLPENGMLCFFEQGWPGSCVDDLLRERITEAEYEKRIQSVNNFERQLKNNGYLVIKFFLTVSKEKQEDAFEHLTKDESMDWIDAKHIKFRVKNYDNYVKTYEDFIFKNDPKSWNILNASEKSTLKYNAFKVLYEGLGKAIKKGKYCGKAYKEEFPLISMPKLKDVDLSPVLTQEDYKLQLKEYQDKLKKLQGLAASENISTVIGFEGWDAAGKGSAIRRLTYPLDPRLFTVYPIASPEPHEKNNHFLWRFWQRMPQTGHISVFDRTWYGRVMVERLEGFCEENDWKRAYNEINEFEKELSDNNIVVIKFWLHIDKDTQLARFTERQNTPAKQWKITDEDWRNRDKWDSYENAIDEMIQKTSTEYAPWTIVEADNKLYARVKVLKTVCDALEAAINNK